MSKLIIFAALFAMALAAPQPQVLLAGDSLGLSTLGGIPLGYSNLGVSGLQTIPVSGIDTLSLGGLQTISGINTLSLGGLQTVQPIQTVGLGGIQTLNSGVVLLKK